MNAIKQDREKIITAACIDDDTIDTVMLQVKRHIKARQVEAKRLLNAEDEEKQKHYRERVNYINTHIESLLGL